MVTALGGSIGVSLCGAKSKMQTLAATVRTALRGVDLTTDAMIRDEVRHGGRPSGRRNRTGAASSMAHLPLAHRWRMRQCARCAKERRKLSQSVIRYPRTWKPCCCRVLAIYPGPAMRNQLYGNSGANTLNGGAGADVLSGSGGNDTFVFYAGQADGDTVTDFAGNATSAGDSIRFVGYGPAATFTNIDATHWQVNYNGGASHEIIKFSNGSGVDATDLVFV